MSLYLHELTHLTLSLLVAFIIWKKLHKHIGVFIAALLGGVLVDLDHLIDYFLAFGTNFNLTYFLKGYAFLKTDKIYVLFHSWELVIFLFLVSLLFTNFINFTNLMNFLTLQTLLLAFSLSLFLHLIVDVQTNSMKAQSYFLLYRMSNNFELKTMVTTDHYQKHLQLKNQVIF